jgi:hypothetical protein
MSESADSFRWQHAAQPIFLIIRQSRLGSNDGVGCRGRSIA